MHPIIDSLEPRRLMAAGSIDPSFTRVAASIPVVRTDLTDARPIDVGYDIDGSAFMLVSVDRSGSRLPALMRVNADGSRDASFGAFGLTVLELGLYSHDAKAIAVDGAGRVNILATVKTTEGSNPMVMVTQINRRGQIIARFGQRGNSFPRFGDTSTAADIAVDPLTNNILVLDTTSAVARLSVSGRYDTTFGSRSIVRTLAGAGATGIGESIATDGTKVLVGTTINTRRGSTDWCVTQLRMSNGAYDLSFGRRGFTSIDIAGGRYKLDDITIDGDGKPVIVGKRAYTLLGQDADALVTIGRLTTSGQADTSLSATGTKDGLAIRPEMWGYRTRFTDAPALIVATPTGYRIANDRLIAQLTSTGDETGRMDRRNGPVTGMTQHEDRTLIASVSDDEGYFFGWGDTGYNELTASITQVKTVGSVEWTRSLTLMRAIDTIAVGADGALFRTEVNANANERTAIRTGGDGQTLSRQAMERDPGFADNAQPTAIHTGYALPRTDGGFDLVYRFQDLSDNDGGSYAFWAVDPSGTITTGIGTSDETSRAAFADLPFDQFSISTHHLHGEAWESEVFDRGDVIRNTWFSFYDYELEPPQLDRPPLVSVPILGSTDIYVKIQIPVNPEPGDAISYQVARVDADDNYVSSFAGTGYMTIADFTPLYGQYDGRLLYRLAGANGLRRLNADGTTDTTFGSKGVMAEGFDHFDIDSKGRLIAWRVIKGNLPDGDVQIMRFSQNGKVDTTFGGGDGLIIVDARLPSTANANVVIDTNDNLVVTAYRQSASAISWSATRILGD